MVELVIRRFDQHYRNFCGFDTIETARLYLAVFEKLYRFTPLLSRSNLGFEEVSPGVGGI